MTSSTTRIRTLLAGGEPGELCPEVVAGLVASVVRCLRATLGVEAVVASCRAPHATPTIQVALQLDGDVRGPVTWVFPPAVALELVRRLLAPAAPPPDAAIDGATELANILTGRATEVLEAHGFRCDLGVPELQEEGALPEGVRVRMQTPQGPIDLVLGIAPTA